MKPRARSGPLPTFVIIGAPKAGTTSLFAYLEAHPEVFVAPRKEIFFFGFNFERGVDWYRSRFERASGQRAIGEATPWYLWSPEAPAQMASVIPHARLIAILRNPADRAYSHFWMDRNRFSADASFEKIVRPHLETPWDRVADKALFLRLGIYLPQLERVCASFPRSSLLVLLLDDLVADPEGTFAKVCRFIGVDDTVRPSVLGKAFNPPAHRSERFHEAIIGLDLWQRSPGLARLLTKMNRKQGAYQPMDPSFRSELMKWYAEPNAQLAAWLGRDLSSWSGAVSPG
jgi:hypothetical protein